MLFVLCQLLWPFLLILAVAFCTPIVFGVRDILFAIDTKQWSRAARGVALAALPGVLVAVAWGVSHRSVFLCAQAPYWPPPPTLQDSELLGTWEAEYGRSVDRLILSTDRRFKQVYTGAYMEGYVYETGWNRWGVQRLADGRVRVHLQGARFYPDGIAVAEEGGWGHGAGSFYDPVTGHVVPMQGKLVLNVRVDPQGELILYQMWSSGDQGFAMTGCERDIFRRVGAP